MTQEITNEIRAKIILLYVGSQFKLTTNIEGNQVIETLTPIAACDWIEDLSNQYADYFPSDKRSQLILKPLSSISDEDCYCLADLLFEVQYEQQIQSWGTAVLFKNWKIIRGNGYLNMECLDMDRVSISIYNFSNNGFLTYCTSSAVQWMNDAQCLKITDYLRSKHYALPAYGIPDLFAAGLAIQENIKTEL